MRKVLFLMIALMSLIACKNSETPQTLQSLTLSADKSEILADGEQIVTFTISIITKSYKIATFFEGFI